MNNPITFFVEGEPKPKQSFRVAGRGRGYTPARVKAWQTHVSWCAQLALRRFGIHEPLAGYMNVELTFFLGNFRKVDWDNLAKCVCDGLNNIAWIDDHQNITVTVDKYICHERQGVLVKITESNRALEVSLEEMNLMIDMYTAEINPVLLEMLTV